VTQPVYTHVRYEKTTYGGNEVSNSDSILRWLGESLKSGGIESQLEKMRRLLVLVATDWVSENPHRVDEVARAIKAEGYCHRIDSED